MLNELDEIFDMKLLAVTQKAANPANQANVPTDSENLFANHLLMPANVTSLPSRNQSYISNVSNTLASDKSIQVEDISRFSDITSANAFVNQKLSDFHARTINSSNLNELYSVLKDFNRHNWILIERRDMSNGYTPVAKRLIEKERADKYRSLENLAVLCWRRRRDE
jgi:hypothetical protein